MSQTLSSTTWPICIRCGGAYRPAPWGRSYLCPGCGSPLHGRSRKSPRALQGVLLGALPVVILVGLIAWRAVSPPRVSRTVSTLQGMAPTDQVRFPRGFRDRLVRKAALLGRDAELDPDSTLVHARLAETYFFLSVWDYPKDPASSKRWQQRAAAVTRKLARFAPELAAQLDVDIRRPETMAWTSLVPGTVATRNWGGRLRRGLSGPLGLGLSATPLGGGIGSPAPGPNSTRMYAPGVPWEPAMSPEEPTVTSSAPDPGPGSAQLGSPSQAPTVAPTDPATPAAPPPVPGVGLPLDLLPGGRPIPGLQHSPQGARPPAGAAPAAPSSDAQAPPTAMAFSTPGSTRPAQPSVGAPMSGAPPVDPLPGSRETVRNPFAPGATSPTAPFGPALSAPMGGGMVGMGGPDQGVLDSLNSQARQMDAAIRVMRRRLRHDPGSIWLTNALGRVLEDRADIEDRKLGEALRRPGPGGTAFLREALRVYEDGARASKTQLHRATFLYAASQICGKLQDSTRQYGLLKASATAAPYAVPVWSDLLRVSLSMGRWDEARRARLEMAGWIFPGLQAKVSTKSSGG